MQQGLRPIIGETFGASRRGGTVFTHVRIGEEEYGPLVPKGQLNLLLGLEPLEALRAAVKFGGSETYCIVSSAIVQTAATLSGEDQYPKLEKIVSAISAICKETYLIEPNQVFEELGTSRILNTYMLGALAGSEKTPLLTDTIESALELVVHTKLPNVEAFLKGLHDFKENYPIK
jgi:indolepyruvate ferredoxin oxidoreductase beta subunit